MEKKMKVKKITAVFIAVAVVATAILLSCSEMFLVSVTVSYPFDENNPDASPSKYEIDINDGLELLDRTLSKQTKNVTEKVAEPLKTEIENNIRSEFGNDAEISFEISTPSFVTDDFVELISGQNVSKSITVTAIIKPASGPEVENNYERTVEFSICDFDDNSVFADNQIRMDIENISDYCEKNEPEREARLSYCLDEKRTTENLREDCVYLKVSHENKPIKIALSEVKELKSYSKFIEKIYSATLNDLSFAILETPEFSNEQKASSFILEAELFSQPVAKLLSDGTECSDTSNEDCIDRGINEEGKPENYFSEDPDIKVKYLVGKFGADSFETGESLELLYTYHGKDILQKSIKNLDFHIGAKSYYLFFPQAGRPVGKLSMDIKAKLFFSVEPL
jgi:hypothetical protein